MGVCLSDYTPHQSLLPREKVPPKGADVGVILEQNHIAEGD